MVELKAELYRAQQDAKLAEEGLLDEDCRDRKQAGIDVSGILGRRNAGVEQRSAKDELMYKVGTALSCSVAAQINDSIICKPAQPPPVDVAWSTCQALMLCVKLY